MKQRAPRAVVLGVVAAIVVAAVAVVWFQGQDPTGAARGRGGASDLWTRLGDYDKSFLRSWKHSLAEPATSTLEVLEAFSELGYAVTGPGGFWRKTVPGSWLGCEAHRAAPACVKLGENAADFAKWDALQEEIGVLDERSAKRFMRAHGDDLHTYLDRYVSATPSASAMEATGFYKEQLAGLFEGNAPAAEGDL